MANPLHRFYEKRQFKPVWMGPEGVTMEGAAFLNYLNLTLDVSFSHLETYVRYIETIVEDGSQLMQIQNTFPLEALIQAEVGLTQIALYLAFQTSQTSFHIDQQNETKLLPDHPGHNLYNVIENQLWEALCKANHPRQKPYLNLVRCLNYHENILDLGGWPYIPDGPKLRKGNKDSRVPLLRKRLIISRDMGLETLSVDRAYDEAMVAGVKRFQQRHGLACDGVLGPKTLKELNVSVQSRINQIKINMARWHKMPDKLGACYILVNIPGFRLDMVEAQRKIKSMRVIVGKNERRTPVMSAKMTYVEINPYWNIPRKIACKDLLPKILQDPGFLIRQNIQVFKSWKSNAPVLDPLSIDWQRYSETFFPFRLRQEPVIANALGQIKFMFPNRFSVYIHDTPAKSLFNKNIRNFSSGCVRIEEPMALAEYLLSKDQRWNREKLQEKVKSRKREVVVLHKPITVHLVYMTAWAEENGTAFFYPDLYQLDGQMLVKLKLSDQGISAYLDGVKKTDSRKVGRGKATTAKHPAILIDDSAS